MTGLEYITEIIKEYPVLSNEEQIMLLKQYQTEKNMDTRDSLICSNLKLVLSRIHKYNHNVYNEDLFQEGMLGLFDAIEKFDTKKFHNSFSTYATYWIDNYIIRYIKNNQLIRLPENVKNDEKIIKNFIEEYKEKNNKEPTIKEIINGVGMEDTNTNYEKVLFLTEYENMISLNTEIESDSNTTELEDLIENKNVNVEQEIIKKTEKEYIRNLILQKLEGRELDVIKKRFGIDCTPVKITDIAKEYKVSKQRIQQIERSALRKLRRDKNLREYFLGES